MDTQIEQKTQSTTRGLTRIWDLTPMTDNGTLDLPSRVMAARNLTDPNACNAFLNPTLKELHNPSLIPDLDKAATRILQAIENNEQITIFGDYDVDGITASAILLHILHTISPDTKVTSYIPHRLDEGYGLNPEAIKTLANQGTKLLITVDCGITAIEPAQTAKELGLDLIITDHHNPPEDLADIPDAFAVVHPRRPDSIYPFGELCGAGVAYKLAWRLATMHCDSEKVTPALRATLVELLVLAALGTIADVVPLIDENRVITKFGLSKIKSTSITGLHALIQASGLGTDQIDAEAVGFRLAPRLNAIGRLGHAGEALELLTTAKGPQAEQLAEQLSHLNDQRRTTEKKILDQALEMVQNKGMDKPDKRAIVLSHQDWHPGVVGIVCSRLVDRFAKPTILMQQGPDTCKGSARSIQGFSIHQALESCSSHLTSFGGHDMAAGMSCTTESFDQFAESIIGYANTHLTPQDLIHTLKIDASATINELNQHSITTLESLAPFGAGNSRIRVLIKNARLNGQPEPFGKTGTHLSLRIGDATNPRQVIRVIGWNWWQKARHIGPGSLLDLVVEPKLSHWNGRTKIEPLLCDLSVRQ